MSACPALTQFGLGTAPLGGLFADVAADAARATIDGAWDAGVRFFDTAPLYGSGLAEERLGEALTARPRDAYVVSTKVGRVLVGEPPTPVFDFGADAVRRSLTESLRRLRLERADIVLVHDPEDHLDDARRALGVVRELAPCVGVGTNFVATALSFVERGEVDLVLLAGRYTLLDRGAADELLPLCLARGVPVVAAGVFNSGVLAGGATFDYAPAPPDVLARRDALAAACARHGVPLAAAALQFPLRHPAVVSVLVGARSPAELEEDARLLGLTLPDALWSEL